MATTPRKSIFNIFEEVKQKAKVEIITAGIASIAAAFDDLKIEVTQLKGFDPTYVAPWEIKQKPIKQAAPVPSSITTPRIRKFVHRNAMDGIIYAVYEMTILYPKWPKFDSGEIQIFIKDTLDVSYSQPWMSRSLETLFNNKDYRDLNGRRVVVTRTCGSSGHYRVSIP